VADASYGRVECVSELVAEVSEPGTGDLVTARQGRNAQRLLDAILASQGNWLDVSYD